MLNGVLAFIVCGLFTWHIGKPCKDLLRVWQPHKVFDNRKSLQDAVGDPRLLFVHLFVLEYQAATRTSQGVCRVVLEEEPKKMGLSLSQRGEKFSWPHLDGSFDSPTGGCSGVCGVEWHP